MLFQDEMQKLLLSLFYFKDYNNALVKKSASVNWYFSNLIRNFILLHWCVPMYIFEAFFMLRWIVTESFRSLLLWQDFNSYGRHFLYIQRCSRRLCILSFFTIWTKKIRLGLSIINLFCRWRCSVKSNVAKGGNKVFATSVCHTCTN